MFSDVKTGTCAIGIQTIPAEDVIKNPSMAGAMKVFGTGFLVAKNVVLTNRHVLDAMNNAVRSDRDFDRDGYRATFFHPNGERLDQTFHWIEKFITVGPKKFDLALMLLKTTLPEPSFLSRLTTLKVCESLQVEVGAPVGVYGFAYGNRLVETELEDSSDVTYRFGAIFQRGYISAFAPFDHAKIVDRILLDVRTAVGMSGAPVLDLETGEVVGVHSHGIGDNGIVAFAIPLTAPRIAVLLDALNGSGNGAGELPRAGRT